MLRIVCVNAALVAMLASCSVPPVREIPERDPSAPPTPVSETKGASSNEVPGWYVVMVQEKIAARWNAPTSIERTGKLRAKIQLVVMADGTVARSEMIESSGEPQFDQAAMHAIQSAQPFPGFPDGVQADQVEITTTFAHTY